MIIIMCKEFNKKMWIVILIISVGRRVKVGFFYIVKGIMIGCFLYILG